jgi:predicted nucleotidyltransferase
MFLEDEDFTEVTYELKRIRFRKPFQILFYGSRARGEATGVSDYNFYLLASTEDQFSTNFIRDINAALNMMDSDVAVSLVAGDYDSLRYRVKIFEPTAVHLCELAIPVFGSPGEFEETQIFWKKIKSGGFEKRSLLSYLTNRLRFYKNLQPKTTKEDVSKLEKILSLTLQSWIITNIEDITTTEICQMDIPDRLINLIDILYKKDTTEEIQLVSSIYQDVHELKRAMRITFPYTDDQLSRIKSSISQIEDLSNFIAYKV